MTSSKPYGPRQVPPPQGTTPRAANAYARFIPREELQDFASWTPDAFAGAPRQQGGLRAPAPPAPEPVAPEPVAEAAGPTEADWLARVQEARQQGWHDGHRDGLEALEAAKRQFAQQTSAQMTALLASTEARLAALEIDMAQALMDSAVMLARQVVRSELATRPELVAQVAQDAVAALMLSARQLRMRLHPDDVALVAQGAADALKSRDVLLLADAQVERGGCLLESDLGLVDARIEQRWMQAAAVFNAPVAWEAPMAAAEAVPVVLNERVNEVVNDVANVTAPDTSLEATP
ncbi:MAG: flagellar biosynthesis protein [Burkholderiales bacterium PBB6]|nr:MAG: flagellar biosynthesis protein [Burkholderiales bacterium PBB6]